MNAPLAVSETAAVHPLPAPGLVVRPVVRADAPILIALCEEHAGNRALERRPYGPPRAQPLELLEVLFEPPFGAWAWIAEIDGAVVGYASATAGFSMLERAYCLHLDEPYLRAAGRDRGVETELLRHALLVGGSTGRLRAGGRHHMHVIHPLSSHRRRVVRRDGPVRTRARFTNRRFVRG